MKASNKGSVINNTQFWALIACTVWPTVIGYGAGAMAREAGRDIWLGGILALSGTVILALLLVFVGRKFPNQTVIEYSSSLLGKIPAKALGLLLFLYFLLASQQSVAIYIHHVTDYLLPETPFLVITLTHIVVVCYLVWQGPEVIARVSVIGFINAALFNLLLLTATAQNFNLDRILPILDEGLFPVLKAGMTASSFIGPNVLMIAMLLPLIASNGKPGRSTLTGFMIGGTMFIFYFVSELFVMGPHTTGQMRLACMELVRSISITKYLHRFESGMALLWYWSVLVQAGILFYCAVFALQQTFGLKKIYSFMIIMGGATLVVLIYLLAFSHVVFMHYLEGPWKFVSVSLEYGIPLTLFAVTLIRKPQ